MKRESFDDENSPIELNFSLTLQNSLKWGVWK